MEGNYPEISYPFPRPSHKIPKAISSDTGPVPGYWGDIEWGSGQWRTLDELCGCLSLDEASHCHPDSHGQVAQSFNQTPYLPLQSSTALPHLQLLRMLVMRGRYRVHSPSHHLFPQPEGKQTPSASNHCLFVFFFFNCLKHVRLFKKKLGR